MEPSTTESWIRSPVRPLATVGLVGTLCYMAVIGQIATEAFIPLVYLVLEWWFKERSEQHKVAAEVKVVEAKVEEKIAEARIEEAKKL